MPRFMKRRRRREFFIKYYTHSGTWAKIFEESYTKVTKTHLKTQRSVNVICATEGLGFRSIFYVDRRPPFEVADSVWALMSVRGENWIWIRVGPMIWWKWACAPINLSHLTVTFREFIIKNLFLRDRPAGDRPQGAETPSHTDYCTTISTGWLFRGLVCRSVACDRLVKES